MDFLDNEDAQSEAPPPSVAGSAGGVPLDDFENVAGGMTGPTSVVDLMPEEDNGDDDDQDSEGSSPIDEDGDSEEDEGEDDDEDGEEQGSEDDDEEEDGEVGRKRKRLFEPEEDSDDEDDDDLDTGGFSAGMQGGGVGAKSRLAPDMSPEEIQQLKLDVLFKMGVLHQAGYKSPREYSVDDTLQTLQIELQRLQTAEDMAYGLEMCRWGVVNGVSVLESMNEGLKLTPLKLKGWSATVHRRQHTLDPILLELYQTYFYKVHLGPVTKLSMALGLAAVNTHMANTVRASVEGGEPGDPAAGGMPGFANVIGSMMGRFRPPPRPSQQQQQQGSMAGPGAGI